MKNVTLPIREIDHYIRSGQGALARTELSMIPPSRLDHADLADYAWLALRADLPMLGVKALCPIVRSAAGTAVIATEREKAVYAACLGKIGAFEESLALLSELDAQAMPEVHLFRAFTYSSQWEFAQAIPELKAYLKSDAGSPYDKLVAKVNLSAALVYERNFLAAEPLLRELLFEASLRGLALLLGKAFELTAASFVLQRKWKQAEAFLDRSGQTLAATGGRDEFFARKWRVICDLGRSRFEPRALEALHQLREEAKARGYWESVRDCDRFEGILMRDDELFQRVYFGTPYSSLRKRLREETDFQLPETYVWQLGDQRSEQPVDLFDGKDLPPALRLKPSQLRHRLLLCFVSDLYRPLRLPTLHYLCYPNEFFNPVTSPPRVYEAIRRLRRWMQEAGLPLQIQEKDGAYVLEATAPFALVLRREVSLCDRLSSSLRKLRSKWPGEAFQVREVARCLGISNRTALSVLTQAVAEAKLIRQGNGSSTRYCFPSLEQRAA